ncbi:MAG: ATP synthase subunit I [Desulfobacteraceae bacterium]|nr:ATP synthase subunit I [Desulfobacteraceae bacterium]
MMNETLGLALSLAAGVLLGAVFFVGLWWTVLKGVATKRPAAWFLGSLILRSIISLAGFYLVSDDNWKRMLMCLSGFVIARLICTRLQRTDEKPARLAQEADHAP